MELKNQYMIIIGVVVLVVLLFGSFLKKKSYAGGKKISSMYGVENTDYFKRRMRMYRVLRAVATGSFIATIAISFLLLARPYTALKENEEQYKRDIILCMDVSSSVNELNTSLVQELKDTVKQLKGERFGIVIFNTSGVMLCPLTDDYEYVLTVLDNIHSSLTVDSSADEMEWVYNMHYMMDGTDVGGEERGSSLIGDGLATAACDFPDISEDRTRIIILSTDNELDGTPIFWLDEAADLCLKKKITVYGIGTNLMADTDMASMKSAVEKTGGKFYLEEKSGTVGSIVDRISKEAKSLVKGRIIVKEIPWIQVPIILLCISFALQILSVKLLKI